MSRLNAWDNLTKRYLPQSRDEGELIGVLHVLYYHSAMTLYRYVRYSEIDRLLISVYIRSAYDHARLMLEVI